MPDAYASGMAKQKRGFANMDPEEHKRIASRGGQAAHRKRSAHVWNSEEAREAGRKGGKISRGGRGRLPTPDTETR